MNEIDMRIQHTSILVNKLLAKEDLYSKKKLKTEKTISAQQDKLTRIIKREKDKFQKMKARLEKDLTVVFDEIQTMKIEFDEKISQGLTSATPLPQTIEKKGNNYE